MPASKYYQTITRLAHNRSLRPCDPAYNSHVGSSHGFRKARLIKTTLTSRAPTLLTASPPHANYRHGHRPHILLSSVFGPYAQDDQYGSRVRNPMELYHNQVTRVQGPFSLRLFHRSWGLMLIQANLDAPCTLLDYPSLDRFVEELRSRRYEIVGISGIVPNFLKVKKMCELVREHLPEAKIIVGGHVANIPDLARQIDADHVVRGEGVRWFRTFLGEDPEQPVRHPQIIAGHGTRTVGVTARRTAGDMAATVIPSVGCPVGCNFCSTSAMFGGKGHSVRFYQTGDELFDIMRQLEANLKVQSFFMMDENFLLDRGRALRLLELMERHDKAWALYLFSSARALSSYSSEQLVRLGLTWVWLGLEGEDSRYAKLHGADTRALVRRLQAHGTRGAGLDDHRAGGPHAREHRRRDRARRESRHRLPPVHALHAAARHAAARRAFGPGADEGRKRVRPGRHSRAVTLQLPASPHPRRPGDGAPGAGLSARLRGQRPEHGADGADHAGRLEAVQEPSRSARPPPLRLGSPRTCPASSRPWSPLRGFTTAAIPRCGRRWMPC